jgi:hypothetical protein
MQYFEEGVASTGGTHPHTRTLDLMRLRLQSCSLSLLLDIGGRLGAARLAGLGASFERFRRRCRAQSEALRQATARAITCWSRGRGRRRRGRSRRRRRSRRGRTRGGGWRGRARVVLRAPEAVAVRLTVRFVCVAERVARVGPGGAAAVVTGHIDTVVTTACGSNRTCTQDET